MDPLDARRILLGLVLLVVGGELLVRGASALAVRVGLSPLTVEAVLDGQPDLAVGNVVGSNIANVLLILGLAALVLPLAAREQLVRLDVPFLVGLSGLLLLLAMVVHTVLTVVVSRRGSRSRRAGGDGSPVRCPWRVRWA